MNTYRVFCYEPGFFFFIPKFCSYKFTTEEPFDKFSKRISRDGFLAAGEIWIAPGSVLSIHKKDPYES